MTLQFSEINEKTQSRVFDGAKVEFELFSLGYVRYLDKKMDWWVALAILIFGGKNKE